MKKILSIGVSLFLGIGLIGCRKDGEKSSAGFHEIVCEEGAVTHMVYLNHEYLLFQGGGVVHNPDCMCKSLNK